MAVETLDARLSKITYHKPDRFAAGQKYLIGKTTTGLTVKGHLQKPIEGECYRFFGSYRDQKKYDPAFEFDSFEVVVDGSVNGVTNYLANYVDGLGRSRSRAIVEHFGVDTLAILRSTPERAIEVTGITEKIVANITKHFRETLEIDPVAYSQLVELFNGHKVGKKVITTLVKEFGANAAARVKEYPYATLMPLPRMGWKGVDALAMTNLGYDPNGLDRHMASILEALENISSEGHTYSTKTDAEVIAFSLINGRPCDEAWDGLIAKGEIVIQYGPQGTEVALAKLDAAERSIAEQIKRLSAGAKSLLDECLPTDGLNEDQRYAVEMIETNAVSLLTGAPGTGKSYSVAKVIKGIHEAGFCSILVVAPTGKAAKRAAELIAKSLPNIKIPCQTIHKALSPTPSAEEIGTSATVSKFNRGRDEFGFGRNEGNPLECDYLFVDESSMAEVCLFDSLLRATPTGTKIVIIGDPNQLPSVGPGSALRDMVSSGLPCVTLDKIVRSDGGGRVVRACHAIKDGRRPEPAAKIALDTENWVHIEVELPEEIANQIVELHRPTKRFSDPVWDIQVVTPQRTTAMGCDNLNRLLSEKLNPVPVELRGIDEPGNFIGFRIGDKVVRTKNGTADEMLLFPTESHGTPDIQWRGVDYRAAATAVVNGDMGTVLDIVEGEKGYSVIVQFRTPDRLCRMPIGDCHLLQAYAMTCHKAQGSGFPFVIVPVHHGFYWDAKNDRGLWNREWIYTAISRAETLLITVGQFSAIETAIRRKTVNQRNTRLKQRLQEIMPRLTERTPFDE